MNSRIILAALVLAASVSALQTIKDDLRVSPSTITRKGGNAKVDSSLTVGKRPTSTNLHTVAGWEDGNDTVKQSTTAPYADTAAVSRKSLLTTHGVTSGTVPKAATDSTFTNSHISENGDTVNVSSSGAVDTMVWVDVGTRFNDVLLSGVAYGAGNFAAISPYSPGANVVSSTDGINWSAQSLPPGFNQTSCIDYCGGRFVVPTYEGSIAGATSTDATHWDSMFGLSANNVGSAYGNGIFAAVSSYSYISNSSNGITWNYTYVGTDSLPQYPRDVSFGNGVFVSVCNAIHSTFSTSIDGVNWTPGDSLPVGIYLTNIDFLNGEFWTTARSPFIFLPNMPISDTCILRSSDGVHWSAVTTPTTHKWLLSGMAYGNGWYVAPVADSALSENGNLVSSDGINWSYVKNNIQLPAGSGLNMVSGITFGDSVFVATTYNDVGCQIMYSYGPYEIESGLGAAKLRVYGGFEVKNEVQIDSTPRRPLDVVIGKSAATGDTVVSMLVDSLDVDSARSTGSVDGYSVSSSTVTSTSYFTAPDNDTLKRISVSNTLASLGLADSLITKKVRADRVHVDSIWHAYGGFQDSAVTISIASSNDWQPIRNASGTLWNGLESDGLTLSSDTMVFVNGADYIGSVTVTVSGLSNKDFKIRLYNVTQDIQMGYMIGGTTSGAGNYLPISLPLYVEANASDKMVMQITCVTDGSDPTIRSAVFYLTYLHD